MYMCIYIYIYIYIYMYIYIEPPLGVLNAPGQNNVGKSSRSFLVPQLQLVCVVVGGYVWMSEHLETIYRVAYTYTSSYLSCKCSLPHPTSPPSPPVSLAVSFPQYYGKSCIEMEETG